jgi:hypothetical protein
MFKAALISLALLAPVGARTVDAARSKPTRAQTITKSMVQALNRQSRVVASGTIKQGTKPINRAVTSYRLRYQAPGREDIWMRSSGKGGIKYEGMRRPVTKWVLIGTQRYSSFAGSRWIHGTNGVKPTALDALGINMQGAICCTQRGVRKGESVWLEKTTTWNGHRAYQLGFKGSSNTGSATGTLYVDTGTHLPLHFDEQTLMPSLRSTGTFNLSYGGNFTIQAPK